MKFLIRPEMSQIGPKWVRVQMGPKIGQTFNRSVQPLGCRHAVKASAKTTAPKVRGQTRCPDIDEFLEPIICLVYPMLWVGETRRSLAGSKPPAIVNTPLGGAALGG